MTPFSLHFQTHVEIWTDGQHAQTFYDDIYRITSNLKMKAVYLNKEIQSSK